jgi:hypothetical protein
MTRADSQKYAAKHGPEANVDHSIKDKVIEKAKAGELSCAAAFKIAETLKKPPAEIGKAVDLLELRLVKCQLGLFGYQPRKKIVTPKAPENAELEDAVRASLENGKLSCRNAWGIADRLNVSKMTVSAACEALQIKIKPCQLGAF